MGHTRATIILVALALAGPACGSSDDGESEQEQADEQSDDGASGFGSLGLMGSLLSAQLDEPGLYDPPTSSDDYSDRKPYTAVLELEGAIGELRNVSLLGGSAGVELRRIADRLGELAADDRVSGVLLRIGELQIDLPLAEELRAALGVARPGGGDFPVRCYTDSASTLTYYVMTGCDEIALAPGGSVMVTGIAAMPVHVKGLLDRLGVRADFLHIGTYKGAAEPLTRDAPSAEMNETLDAILDRGYATLKAGIAEGRGLSETEVAGLIDRALFVGDAAVDAKLADRVALFESERDGAGPWKQVAFYEQAKPGIGELMEMLGMTPASRPRADHVALVYAVGNVVDGGDGSAMGARDEIASHRLVGVLRRLASEDSVTAVVLRVSSPGGSALASELIWHAVRDLAARKPVVVSMGGMAASGGYYIASAATEIVAGANTLTGSIGVVGGKIAVDRALADVGVTTHPRGRGKRALMMASLGSWSADERASIKTMMESTYQTFLARVAEGRKLPAAEVDRLARGRVWTGADALERKLVDRLGGLDVAMARARELGKVAADAPIEVYPPKPTLIDYVKGLSGEFSASLIGGELRAELVRRLGPAAAGAVDQLFGQLELMARAPVQTALLFPVVVR